MAVSSSSSAASDQNKWQNEMKQQTTNPGEHVMDGNIYGAEKVKTCHQCHQRKTRSFATACKNQRKKKPCTLLYCHSCLLNRYGEKAEEAQVSEAWSCPRCRDICNCYRCRIKQGHLPTGNLCRKAKAAGYSSVSELLHAKGPENFGFVKNANGNANDTGASLKKRGASKKIGAPRKKGKEIIFDGHEAETVVTESSISKEIVVAEGIVLDVQPLTAIPLQQSSMEEMNYPSEDVIEEFDEAAKDVTMEDAEISQSLVPKNSNSTPHQTADLPPVLLSNVPSSVISSKIAVPDSTHNIDENGEVFVDVNSPVKDPNAPPSPHFDYYDQIFPETFDGVQGIGITLDQNFEFIRKIGVAEKHAAGKKMLTYHSIPDSPEKRKAMEEEISIVNQQTDEEANKKKTDDLVALRNDVDKLTTKIAGIDENVAITSHAVKDISKNVRKQAATSYADHQALVEKVNLLQQSQDSYMETQLHMLSLLMGISKQLGTSVDDIKKGEKKLGDTACRVEAVQKKDDGEDSDDGDTHGPSGFEGSKRLQDKSLGKLPESDSSQPETVKEKPSESRKRRRDATVQTNDVLRMETILDDNVFVIQSQQTPISATSQSSEIQTLTQPERRDAEKYTFKAPPGIVSEKSSNFVTSISVDKPEPVEEINAEKPSYKLAHEFQAFDQRARSGLGLAKAKMVESDNFRPGDDPAPLYDSLLEPLSQKHLDKVETAVVVHTMRNGEVSGETLIYFLKGGRTMKINQDQLLLFKKQLELEYLVHIMHDRSFVHRRWITKMKTKMRQITRLLTRTKEQFKPKYVCDKDGKEKEMPHGSVTIQHDQLRSYMEYTQSQVGMSSITLDDINDYVYTPSELRAAYWQITGADDESVKIRRKLKKALEKAEFKLLEKFLQKNPSFREIPDGYELDH